MNTTEDKRPDPKPRKHAHLWQAYLMWDEMVEMRKRHDLRISSSERGKSLYDPMLEEEFLSILQADKIIDLYKKTMVEYGKQVGPVWGWLTSIRGLGEGNLAAQLLAQIDDIGKFTTISKLWRYSGYAVIDGAREYNKPGEKSHFNKRLKSIVWLVGESFIKQQTPIYTEIYYQEKARLREEHPDVITTNGSKKYNDGHLHNMAKRKMMKIFLSHLWLIWRQSEGLPVSDPYAIVILGHTNVIEPLLV